MRHIFIGDIHGCFDGFQLLLQKLNFANDDKVYLVWELWLIVDQNQLRY